VDDCLQAVCVKMMIQAEKPGPDVADSARRAWLFRVAANESAAIWRRRASSEKLLTRLAGGQSEATEASDPLVWDETSRRARQAVARLPAEMREVVRLRIEQNLTFQQISRQLQIPLGTALTRMRRALARLRDELTDEQES
jgi:RNA polymerase sigma-70 factor (ECF subfamily)